MFAKCRKGGAAHEVEDEDGEQRGADERIEDGQRRNDGA
jgi:hypothetical protein